MTVGTVPAPLPPSWPPANAAGRRAVLLAGGEPESAAFVRSVVRTDDLLLAADGGARLASASGVVPHLLVGDVDSITAAEAASLPPDTLRWEHPVDKDWSDLELALQAAIAARAREVVVLGALGGRLDHLLVNVGLLHLAHAHHTPMRLLSERGEALMVDREARFDWPPGRIVSVLALTPEVRGLSLQGFAYPLQEATLRWGSSRGLSNMITQSPAFVSLSSGRLLVVSGAAGRRVRTVVKRTILEMRSRESAHLSFIEDAALRLEPVPSCPPAFYRFLYNEVGEAYHWIDRRDWSDPRIRDHLAQPHVSVWVLYEGGAPAGWFELSREEGSTRIAYFGLLPGYTGRGLGRHLLSTAIERAWEGTRGRVWLHTCTLDDPAALPNYRKRGFEPIGEETYTVDLPADDA